MKRMIYTLLCFAVAGAFVCCTKYDPEVSIPQDEQVQPQTELLENGDAILTYPNGVAVKKTKEGDILWQGDIVLTEEQLAELTSPSTRGLINIYEYWSNGIIFYSWGTITAKTKDSVLKAMDYLNDKCGITFIESSQESDRVIIQSGPRNDSNIGMVGGVQRINIKNGDNMFAALHELAHTLGMQHEQCRPDRDNYIIVYTSNIRPEMRVNFNKVPASKHYYTYDFDFYSMMMYSSFLGPDIAIDPSKPVLTKLDGSRIYGSTYPSEQDIATINHLYRSKYFTVDAKVESSLSGEVYGGGEYTYLSECTLTATPAPYRKFDGWYEDGKRVASSNPYNFTVTEDRNLTAKFVSTTGWYTLKVFPTQHSKPNGGVLSPLVPGGTTSYDYCSVEAGSTIVLRATPNPGFEFDKWKDLESNYVLYAKNNYYHTMTRDIQIQAVFKPSKPVYEKVDIFN